MLEKRRTALSPYTATASASNENTMAAATPFMPNTVEAICDTVAMQLAPPRHIAISIS